MQFNLRKLGIKDNYNTVSVVIPTFRRLDILKKSLEAVQNMHGPVIEVIIVHRPKEDQETTS